LTKARPIVRRSLLISAVLMGETGFEVARGYCCEHCRPLRTTARQRSRVFEARSTVHQEVCPPLVRRCLPIARCCEDAVEQNQRVAILGE
jgi:hypothetical protein